MKTFNFNELQCRIDRELSEDYPENVHVVSQKFIVTNNQPWVEFTTHAKMGLTLQFWATIMDDELKIAASVEEAANESE